MNKTSFLVGTLFVSFGLCGQVQPKDTSSLEELKRELTVKKNNREKEVEILKKQKITIKTEPTSARKAGVEQKSVVDIDSTADGNQLYFKGFNQFKAPVFYQSYNYGGAVATGVDFLRNGTNKTSYYGEGIVLGEWDGAGAYSEHQDFDNRVQVMDGSGSASHATHVAGTMLGSGSLSEEMRIESTQGMAPKASLRSYDWTDDELEMIDEALGGLTTSNHSYGLSAGVIYTNGAYLFLGREDEAEDYGYGFYGEYDAYRDEIVYNLPHYLPVWAAGNDGNNPGLEEGTSHYVWNGSGYVVSTRERKASCWTGYDCISEGSIAKNILTVGAIYKAPYNAQPSDYRITDFSSKGPADDGRIKPDIVAPGHSIVSTNNGGGYFSQNGTSMATPVVTGGIALIQESAKKHLKKQLQASTVKALVINTAKEAGNEGPDYHFGWGVFDAFESVKSIENNGKGSLIEEYTLNTNETKTFYVTSSGSEALKVTIAWTDVPGIPSDEPVLNDRRAMLINDLDLRIYDEKNKVYMPWKLDPNNPSQLATKGDNTVDNVEQIVIENAKKNGVYRIQVSHKGDLMYGGQNFSIVATGLKTKKESDLSILKLESKADQKSYDTPGIYVTLESEGKKVLKDVEIEYVLKNSTQEVVLKKKKKIDFDPSDATPIFLKLEKKDFEITTKNKYKVEVTVNHSEDDDIRNNSSSLEYFYFVERIETSEDLYYQNFFNYNVSLYQQGIKGSEYMNLGWVGNAGATAFSTTGRTKGLSIVMINAEAEIKTNPFYLIANQEYLMSVWARSYQEGGEIEGITFNVKDAFTDAILETVHLEDAQGSGFMNLNKPFSLAKEGYVYLEFINPEGGTVGLDDFTLAFNGSESRIVDYKVGKPLGRGIPSVTKVAWNEFTPILYDQTYTEIVADSTNRYAWKISGSDYVFEEETNVNSAAPKIRLIDPDRFVNVQLMVNEKFSSSTENDLKTTQPYFDFYYLDFIDYYDLGTTSIPGNTYEDKEGKNYIGFRNDFLGFRIGPASSNPYQNSMMENDRGFYKSSIFLDDTTDVEDMSRGKFKAYRFKEMGDFVLSIRTVDASSDGQYFDETVPIHNYEILDQFQPISNLTLEEKDEETFKLKWENPPLYHFEVMTFGTDYENYLKTAQFKGDTALGWRLHSSNPILSVNGGYSMVSESINEETMQHQEIDNWFFTYKKNRAAAQYFSFFASMADDYKGDQYEVYLLDASKINQPENPTVNDFKTHGVIVKTEELTGLDQETKIANYTVLKTVDLKEHDLMNKDLYIAFRHHTEASRNGSFLSIDLLKFHNVLDEEIDLNYRYNRLYQTAGKSDIGWKSLNPHVYPIQGYEIAEIDQEGNRKVIKTIDKKVKKSVAIKKSKISEETAKLGVTLLYDLSSQVDGGSYEQVELDDPNHQELTVDLPSSETTGENGCGYVALYPIPVKHHDDLHLKMKNNYRGKVEYEIYNLFGFKKVQGDFKKKEEEIEQKIKVHHLRSGIYFVKIRMGEKMVFRKFLKM